MELIKMEYKLSAKYFFDTELDSNILKITSKNVAIAEAMLHNNFSYQRMSDKNAKPEKGFDKENSKVYKGSSAFWLTQLDKTYKGLTTECDENIEKIIQYAVNAIDRENGTHLNADKVGRKQIADRIVKIYNDDLLYKWLINQDKKYELFRKIEEKTEPNEYGCKSRTNTSFASKFCHYAALYLFEDKEEQDGYSIWDTVLRKSLPLYIEKYHLNKADYDLNDYVGYQKAIDDIIDMVLCQDLVQIKMGDFSS